MNIILKEDDITDIDKLDDYNNDYLKIYPDFKPFVTPINYQEVLKSNELKKQGINNNGIKEIYYWVILDNKIIGHASIRLNPEVDKNILKYAGHIMYGVIPSKRGLGYGKEICRLLIDKMKELGYKEIIITCSKHNISSIKVIEANNGVFIETVKPDMINTTFDTNRYKVIIKK